MKGFCKSCFAWYFLLLHYVLGNQLLVYFFLVKICYPGVSKVPCFLEALKYLTSKKQSFETPGFCYVLLLDYVIGNKL